MDLQTYYRIYSRYSKRIGPFFKKPRVRAYTFIILSLFTISFFGIFAIRPTLKTIAHLKKRINDSQVVNEALEEKIVHLTLLKEEYKKIENDLPLIIEALPSEPKFSFFLKDLETLAQEAGATIASVRLKRINLTKRGNQSSIKISSSLTLVGDYISLKSFLERLLNSRRIYTVKSFSISSQSEEGKKIKANFNINAYYLSL